MELIAAVPFLLLALAFAAQAALAGHALWSAGVAARAGARAALVGDEARPVARAALPPILRDGVRVREEDGVVRVGVEVPALLPIGRLRLEAAAGLGGDGDE